MKFPIVNSGQTDLHFRFNFPADRINEDKTCSCYLEGEFMKLLFLLPCLLLPGIIQAQTSAPVDGSKSPVVIVDAGWLRDRRSSDQAVQSVMPASAPTRSDKNFERQKRANDPVGVRDPNSDTLDTRGSELERIVQQSRQAPPVNGYTYQLKVQNVSAKVIRNIFWEYEFTQVGNAGNVSHRKFMCGGDIKPDRQRELEIFSLVGPSEVVNVKTLDKGAIDKFRAAVIINRVDYTDGTFWQRHGWSLDGYKLLPNLNAKNGGVCRSM
jgi:hypothetical protein